MKKMSKEWHRQYYQDHIEKIHEYQLRYRINHREQIRARARARYAENHVRKNRSRYDNVQPDTEKASNLFKDPQMQAHYEWLMKNKKKGNANG